jgi:signal transduction histidine kinase
VFLLSIQLARSVTRPIRELERAARRMGEGDLDARVDVPSGPPEFEVLARSFNETADKLRRLVDQQRRFAGDASHQLRTPLAALRLRLENLEAESPDGASEDVEAAIGEVHRLSRLVDGLLALARAEGDDARRAVVDVGEVVSACASRWEPLVEEHGLVLVTSAPHGLWAVATPGHLEQVIDNLVANAVDVAPPGSEVVVHAFRPLGSGGRSGGGGGGGGGGGAGGGSGGGRSGTGTVELHVVDAGPGMTAEQRAHAFDRFWRSTQSRSRSDGVGTSASGLGGSGLGLSIVQQLVVNDGGSVELLEAAAGGLDVCIRLQSAPAPPPPAPVPGETPAALQSPAAPATGAASSEWRNRQTR